MAEKPPRRRFHGIRLALEWLGLAFLLLLCIPFMAWSLFAWWDRREAPDLADAPTVEIIIAPERSFSSIARELSERDIARPELLLKIQARRLGLDRKIQAGRYELPAGASPRAILELLARGPLIDTDSVTIPEGWTLEQVAARLAREGVIADAERFLALCADPAFLESIDIPAPSAQGYLFPDTYRFRKPTAEEAVIRRMADRFRQEIQRLQLLPGMNSPNAAPLTYQQSIVLASILEREVVDSGEMPLVASVFHNRIRRNMPLQSCATVRYAMGKWQGNLTLHDLKFESPYNTYLHAGLPPGPICNPGRAALNAAFRPGKSDYLYFVFRGEGRHAFSTSLREHEALIRQYRNLWLAPKAPAESSAPSVDTP